MALWLRWMAAAAVAVLGGAAAAWVVSAPRPAFSQADAGRFDRPGDAERGRLVFAAADCGSCHASPDQSDTLRLGGGMALDSPFGVFHATNISPDPKDGIGRWRTVDLANALVSGVTPDGKHLYPSMPYTAYNHMSDDDIVDLMAFLRSLAPVAGKAPPHELRFPFSIRRAMGLWKAAFFKIERFEPVPGRSAEWNRGRYLAEALGHCAECHSTRGLFGTVSEKASYAGGPDPGNVGFIPNVTPGAIGSWSLEDIVTTLTTGLTPRLQYVGSSMVSVVDNLRLLPDADRRALAVYLKSLPAKPTPSP